jgi:hypothetical protein
MFREDKNDYQSVKILTLAEAMQIFWNLESAVATASEIVGGTSASIGSDERLAIPSSRVCYSNSTKLTVSDYEIDYDDNYYGTGAFSSVFVGTSYTGYNTGGTISRLYDGTPEDDESNFVGYGVGTIAKAESSDGPGFFTKVTVSGINDESDYDYSDVQTEDSRKTETIDYGGVELFKITQIFDFAGDSAYTSADIAGINFYTYPA